MSLLLETNDDCLWTKDRIKYNRMPWIDFMNGYGSTTEIFIYAFVFDPIWYILIIRPNKYCIPCNNSKSAVWAINLY